MRRLLALTLAGWLGMTAACGTEGPLEPQSTATPQAPAPATPQAPAIPGPLAAILPGTYNFSASITAFDPAWGDFAGYVYTAVLSIQQDPMDGSRLVGRYTDLALRDSRGNSERVQSGSGLVISGVDATGRITLGLKSDENNFTLSGRGYVVGARIDGSWEHAHFSGPFTVVQIKPGQ